MSFLALSLALISAPSNTRIAVVVDDPGASAPARARIEMELQARGYEVVAAEVSERMRSVVAPRDLLGTRLPEGLSVFEADALVAGAASYGDARVVEGVVSLPVSLSARLIDLGTGRTTTTIQTDGRGIGVGGPALATRAAEQAVGALFADARFERALSDVGQEAGMVTLVVQALPSREALVELKRGLERALAGAPVREVYYAKGLGKLTLGGSAAKSMVGPQIADVLGEHRYLAVVVEEVANTRIVARHDPSRTVNVHALVLEPRVPKGSRGRAVELGRYVATKLATFGFARASFQPGALPRARAIERAKAIGAHVILETEIVRAGRSAALVLRVVDVNGGQPIYREQQLIEGAATELGVADLMVAALGHALPAELRAREIGTFNAPGSTAGPRHADREETQP